jgi:hypothetical protein
MATLVAIEDKPTDDGYSYRFRPDERPLGDAEAGVVANPGNGNTNGLIDKIKDAVS